MKILQIVKEVLVKDVKRAQILDILGLKMQSVDVFDENPAQFDEDIRNAIRYEYNLLIGQKTAENIKIAVGSAFPSEMEESMDIRGRNLLNGLPENISISSKEVREALEEPLSHVVDAIKGTLENTPPELAADIIDQGITLAGGGALIRGLDRLIKECYALLGLISYLTAGKQEVRAWTIKNGTKAPQAAGKIHSDFERGFIRAEVIAYDDLIACGSMAAAKEKGLVRSEGKEYVMKDGDVVLFRFNV